jgi:hypothetical protein
VRRALFASLLLGATPALASDEASWREFRAKVHKACEKAVAATLDKPVIAVDPFGSPNYGIAIAKGPSKYGDKAPLTVVCVLNKTTGEVETSGEFAP